jgi:hypothetical protein
MFQKPGLFWLIGSRRTVVEESRAKTRLDLLTVMRTKRVGGSQWRQTDRKHSS